jgi:hypothetical protein
MEAVAIRCSHCGRKTATHRGICLFCRTPIEEEQPKPEPTTPHLTVIQGGATLTIRNPNWKNGWLQKGPKVDCAECANCEVGKGYGLCQGDSWDGKPGQATNFLHPCEDFKQR